MHGKIDREEAHMMGMRAFVRGFWSGAITASIAALVIVTLFG